MPTGARQLCAGAITLEQMKNKTSFGKTKRNNTERNNKTKESVRNSKQTKRENNQLMKEPI
jgi:hypothetical protein